MEFLEVPFFDDDIYKLGVRFSINVFFLTLIIWLAINPNQREREFAFTAVMLNIMVFFICFALKKLELGLGMALGLFAIFGVLRYRTDTIRTKEMTYLFIVIGIAVINSLSNKKTSYVELFSVNFVILGAAMLKEFVVRKAKNGDNVEKTKRAAERKKQRKYNVEYDRLDWLAPQFQAELMADLRERTGIEVERVQIQNIDLRNQSASLVVWCNEPSAAVSGDGSRY